MKMGSLPSLRFNESAFPSLMAQRPLGGEPPNMQGFTAASKPSERPVQRDSLAAITLSGVCCQDLESETSTM